MKTRAGKPLLQSLPIGTTDGVFVARYSDAGLARLDFPSNESASAEMSRAQVSSLILEWHQLTTEAVLAVLGGNRPKRWPPLDVSKGTPFQRNVWSTLQAIEPGKTLSYGELAQLAGSPGAFRAVGGACGANPIPLLIPCHRVLAAGGGLGGFSGGPGWKRLLLDRERRGNEAFSFH
jgi:O-6-methylguanine DNA methyltransferase